MEQATSSKPHHPVNSPSGYTSHPSGVECISISRWFSSNAGQAIQYIWRHEIKGDPIENLEKAVWFLQDEIARFKEIKLEQETMRANKDTRPQQGTSV